MTAHLLSTLLWIAISTVIMDTATALQLKVVRMQLARSQTPDVPEETALTGRKFARRAPLLGLCALALFSAEDKADQIQTLQVAGYITMAWTILGGLNLLVYVVSWFKLRKTAAVK